MTSHDITSPPSPLAFEVNYIPINLAYNRLKGYPVCGVFANLSQYYPEQNSGSWLQPFGVTTC